MVSASWSRKKRKLLLSLSLDMVLLTQDQFRLWTPSLENQNGDFPADLLVDAKTSFALLAAKCLSVGLLSATTDILRSKC